MGSPFLQEVPKHELNTELRLQDTDTIIPWEAFAAAEPEKRVDAVTNLDAGDYGVQSDPYTCPVYLQDPKRNFLEFSSQVFRPGSVPSRYF